jgi:hypothetical protein
MEYNIVKLEATLWALYKLYYNAHNAQPPLVFRLLYVLIYSFNILEQKKIEKDYKNLFKK